MQEAEKMDNPEKAEHMKRQAIDKRKLDIILPQWIEQYGEEDAMQLYNEQLMEILE